MLWLILRSGAKPSRLAYPCQQAALGTATAALAGPLAWLMLPVLKSGRAILHSTAGRLAAGALSVVVVVVFALASGEQGADPVLLTPPSDYYPDVYLVNQARGVEPGRYGGVDDLVTLLGLNGFKWYRTEQAGITGGPNGLIDRDDVVLIKINSQWAQRGGTNTDVLRGVIRRIVEHPDGFVGEIIVGDNEQFASGGMNWLENNAEDHGQSAMDVVNSFATEGWNVSASLWKAIRSTSVQEYSAGDMNSGYVVNPVHDPETEMAVSYPKFRSTSGTYVSYKHGIWSPDLQTYDPDGLVVINLPVLKTHGQYAVTASVKNHMGVVTTALLTNSHNGVGQGGMGTVLAEVRMPDLTIMDCLWILARPGSGPAAYYDQATRRDQLLAGTDPIALDMWAVKHILLPQIIANGYSYSSYQWTQDPDNPDSVFRIYLDLSMSELLAAGITVTNDLSAVRLHVWLGDLNRDGNVDGADFGVLAACTFGPGIDVSEGNCQDADFDEDGDVDLADFAAFQPVFTGAR